MADIVDKKTRSRMMSGIRGANTKPELVVRAVFARLRYKPEINCRELPGKPDIVLRRKKVAVFVHGCFWHGHACHLFRLPASNTLFWKTKIDGNVGNDCRAIRSLRRKGWRVLVIWECALKGPGRINLQQIEDRVIKWLPSCKPTGKIRGKVIVHEQSERLR